MKIERGVAYYPENWDNERIKRDAVLMRECGINLVRMGEFAWSHMEAEEGKYTFGFLVDAVNILGQEGIRSILCTPTSAAPGWMCRKYPEILRENSAGEKAFFGVRDHTCYTSGRYREMTEKLVTELARTFKDNPFVFGWQIDNEAGCSRFPACCCKDCQEGFRKYLKEKYKTLDAINKAWATPFWSGDFSAWEEIKLDSAERMFFGRTVETARFRSRVQADFILFQAKIIRNFMPDTIIGTNNYSSADRYELFPHLDYAGEDNYPNFAPEGYLNDPEGNAFNLVIYGGLKQDKAPWIMETPAGTGFPMKDLTRFYFWIYTAMGYEKIFYFPWNAAPNGNEKVHPHILDAYSSYTGPIYEELKKVFKEADLLLEKEEEMPLPGSPAAVILDHECAWIYAGTRADRRETYYEKIDSSYKAAYRAIGYTHVISAKGDFSRYKLIVLPMQSCISPELGEKLKDFAEKGGVVVMSGGAGYFDEYGNHVKGIIPQNVHDLFGLEIGENRPFGKEPELVYEDTEAFFRKRPVVKGCLNGKEAAGTLDTWTGHLSLKGAETILTFANSSFKGEPFAAIHKWGKGYAIYFAADRVDQALYDKILVFAAEKASIPLFLLPEKILKIRRGDKIFYFNFDNDPISFTPEEEGEDLMKNPVQNGVMTLAGQELAIIKEKK